MVVVVANQLAPYRGRGRGRALAEQDKSEHCTSILRHAPQQRDGLALYSFVAPMSWLVRSDVDAGRREFSFSDWHRSSEDDDDAVE